jgi:ribonuclease BN (tRNA processing enzyme)
MYLLLFLFLSHLHPDTINQIPSILSLTYHMLPTKQNVLHIHNLIGPNPSYYILAKLDHAGYQTDPY